MLPVKYNLEKYFSKTLLPDFKNRFVLDPNFARRGPLHLDNIIYGSIWLFFCIKIGLQRLVKGV